MHTSKKHLLSLTTQEWNDLWGLLAASDYDPVYKRILKKMEAKK